MDFHSKTYIPNPQVEAGIFSKLFFLWILPIFKKGSKGDLNIENLYNCLDEDSAEALGDKIEMEWEKVYSNSLKNDHMKRNGRIPRIGKILIKMYWKYYIIPALLNIFDETVIRIFQTILLKLFIKSFVDSSVTRQEQYIYGFCLGLTSLTHVFIMHTCAFRLFHIALKCKLGLTSLIYRKVLLLNKASQRETTIGQLSNFISSDVNRIKEVILFATSTIYVPIQFFTFTYILWQEFGVSCLAGVGFVFFFSTFQYFTGKYSVRFRRKLSARTDERARLMNEIIHAMRVIKMYAWEIPFTSVIDKLRKHEMEALKQRSYLRAIYFAIFHLSKIISLFLILLFFVICGNSLVADKVFLAAIITHAMIGSMVLVLPITVAGIGELVVGMKRIEAFLILDEHKTIGCWLLGDVDVIENKITKEPPSSLKMENLHASWTFDKLTLENINLNYQGNELVMVVGSVGAGKTSFLNAILGEIPIQKGRCVVNGSTSYVAQEAWIFSGNIRQNILFGQCYDESKYQKITYCCCLEEDFKQWPNGDLTIVGERGVLLSGGQKARIGFARAIYMHVNIYLMDDPLSAVDTNVGRKILERSILGYLGGSLRFLVTHQLQYLPYADSIIVIHDGEVIAQGKYAELLEQNIDFTSLIVERNVDEIRNGEGKTTQGILNKSCYPKLKTDNSSEEKEKMSEGSVTYRTYWEYFRTGDSLCTIFLILVGFPIVQGLISLSSYWLSYWTNQIKLDPKTNLSIDNSTLDELDFQDSWNVHETYLSIYTLLTIAITIGISILTFNFIRYSLKIEVNMHNRMFSSIIRAPIKFFDRQPSGRIMNRFTKDLNFMDEYLPMTIYDTMTILTQTIFVLLIIIYTNYYMVFPTFIIFLCMYRLRYYYTRTSRILTRIEATTRSPLFTHLSSTFQGLSTIRASKCQKLLIQQFDAYQDINSSVTFLVLSANRWFAIWLDFICSIYLIFSILGFLFLSTSILGGDVGLALSTIIALHGSLQWGMRQSAETENIMTSVERILEYTALQPEASLETRPEIKPHKNWPSNGNIRFDSVSLAYNDTNVLEKLTFEIKSKEKLGIVGRTGAGKSSILAALFRLTETDGDIFIDEIRIKDIGLHDLRKSISIIPQDPVLFSGTVRYNLDPFNQHEESEMWQALDEVELKEAIPSLDFIVADGGNNFSVGQKQLVCLARAILRKNKIIVMDEATANVDPKTDDLIQKTIRKTFSECTIVTIAHRLDTVLDCDRILVLDKGGIMEYGTPSDLLKISNGHLSSMLEQGGQLSSAIIKYSNK